MNLSKETKNLAREIMCRSIHGHYVHGLEKGQRLNYEQVAGESVEAAMALEKAIESEETDGAVTRVITLNRAYATGFTFGRKNKGSEELPQYDDPDEAQAAMDGYAQGFKAFRLADMRN